MSQTAPAIPLFGDAYLADTRHLSLEEHGAYLQLMMIAWRIEGCCLPDDDGRLARMLGCTAAKWKKLKPTVMAFWTLENGSWRQARLSKERKFVEEKRAKNRASADARWHTQAVENKEDVECERISERNTPPPPPPREDTASDDADGQVGEEILLPEHVVDEWNRVAKRLAFPRVRDLTPERRQLVRARIAQYSIDDFTDVFGKVERSPFLRGDTGGWRGARFDWIIKKGNFQKVLEGNYDQ